MQYKLAFYKTWVMHVTCFTQALLVIKKKIEFAMTKK